MKKNYLLTPGPTPLPTCVTEALARPIIHHRTPQFRAILQQAEDGLKYVFNTKNDIFIFSSSGTGAMEAAVANLLSPGEVVLTIEGGKFGQRWTEICQAYNVRCDVIEVEWGRAVDPKEIERRIRTNPEIKAIFTTLCETSTGVVNDIEAIGRIVKDSQAILVVDAISSLCSLPLLTDTWSCDMVVAGSQKGLMLPPGLGFISVSPKAWNLINKSKNPRYYFDLGVAKKALDKTDTPFTPAISLIIALNEALNMIRQEGLENIFLRCKKMAEATRQAARALGLELLASSSDASDAVTAIRLPEGIDGQALVKTMRDIYGVAIAGGQGVLKGRIIRIAHMGYIGEFDIIIAITCLEKVLCQLGYKFQLGAGVKAAQKILQ